MIDRETADKLLRMDIDQFEETLTAIEEQCGAHVYMPMPPDYHPREDIPFEEEAQ